MSSGSGQGPGRVFSPYGDLIVIVVATMISRMIGTPVFSDRMEFSAITGGRMPRKLESRRSQMLRGPQYLQLWEIGPIARNVAREQRQPFDCGVRSDVKVRKWSCPLAATAAMSQETLASQEPGLPGQRFSFVRGAGQSSIQGLDSTKTDGYLGVDNRIDNQGRTVGALCECTSRPISPSQVVGGYVQQNVAVDEDAAAVAHAGCQVAQSRRDRKSTRLNSSHEWISYAVFCLKKKKKH